MRIVSRKKAFPLWLKKKIKYTPEFKQTKDVLKGLELNTVCETARCPNIYDCFSQKRATFLILGDCCTRACKFCAVPEKYRSGVALKEKDDKEPSRIKEAVKALGLRHVVITSVTRDDLEDGGAGHFADCIAILKKISGIIIEVLVPDFKADPMSLKRVIGARPDIFSHNIETVPRLYPYIRPQADYHRSLQVLKYARLLRRKLSIKSGFMLGLGEFENEIIEVLNDLKEAGCDIITIGQYLRPTPKNVRVSRFIEPTRFERYSQIARGLGFKEVLSGPFVRSSYYIQGGQKWRK